MADGTVGAAGRFDGRDDCFELFDVLARPCSADSAATRAPRRAWLPIIR